MSARRPRKKVIVFSCSWHAHSSLDNAGKRRMAHSTAIVPIQLSCIGRISPGLIIKAYQGGASGVCLLGCPENECRYQTGNEQAQEVFTETRELLGLLGFNPKTLQYQQLAAGEGESFLEALDHLLKVIAENQEEI